MSSSEHMSWTGALTSTPALAQAFGLGEGLPDVVEMSDRLPASFSCRLGLEVIDKFGEGELAVFEGCIKLGDVASTSTIGYIFLM